MPSRFTSQRTDGADRQQEQDRLGDADPARHLDDHVQLDHWNDEEEQDEQGDHRGEPTRALSRRPRAAGRYGSQPMADDAEPAREPFLRRLLPQTALGLAVLVFFMGVASAFTGAVLYAYYEARQQQTENEIEDFVATFGEAVEDARGVVQSEGEAARSAIENQLDELEQFAAGGETLQALVERVAPSVWFVSTLDETGAPSVGSAFVVFADSEQSFLLASYTTVRAATADPGPDVAVRKGGRGVRGDARHVGPGARSRAAVDPEARHAGADVGGRRLGGRASATACSRSRASGATAGVTQGFVADVSADGIQHDAPVGAAYQGGPLVNTSGEVVAIASRQFSPLGFDPLAVFFAAPVRRACETVIQCPASGQPGG